MSSPGELYNDLVNAIIRPPRAAYHDNDLGPVEFTYGGTLFIREDLRLINKRGLAVMCSFWHRRFQPRSVQAGNTPCVVYCHGNASCRVEALTVMGSVLASGFSLFSFDFSGCGHSEGDYISLGWFEQDDVALALEYLKRTRGISTIILWGRSMGAASCLLAASRDSSIAALVLDSPFASFKQLALETSSLVWSMVDWAGLWEAVWKARIGFGGSRREAAAERQRQQSRQLYQLLQEDGNNQASKRDDDGAMSTMSGMTSMTSRRDHVDFERAMAKEGNGPRGGFGVGGFGVQGTGVIRSSRIAEEPEEEGDGEGGEGEGGDGEGGGGPSAAAAPPPVVAASSGGGNILNRPVAAADESEPPKKAKPFLMRTVLRVVATSVRARAKFNLYKLNPAAAGKSCAVRRAANRCNGCNGCNRCNRCNRCNICNRCNSRARVTLISRDRCRCSLATRRATKSFRYTTPPSSSTSTAPPPVRSCARRSRPTVDEACRSARWSSRGIITTSVRRAGISLGTAHSHTV